MTSKMVSKPGPAATTASADRLGTPPLNWHAFVCPGMVSLLQKMLQLYAAKALSQGSSSPSPVDQVIAADEEQWELVIKQLLQSEATTENVFLEDLQKRMESTVLGQSSGSYTQRVQVAQAIQCTTCPGRAALSQFVLPGNSSCQPTLCMDLMSCNACCSCSVSDGC